MVDVTKVTELDKAIRNLQKQVQGLVAKLNGRSYCLMKFNVVEIDSLMVTVKTLSEELTDEKEAERADRQAVKDMSDALDAIHKPGPGGLT